jgi:hypothetical protein
MAPYTVALVVRRFSFGTIVLAGIFAARIGVTGDYEPKYSRDNVSQVLAMPPLMTARVSLADEIDMADQSRSGANLLIKNLREFQKTWLGHDVLDRIRNPQYTFAYVMAFLVVVSVFVSFRRPKLHGRNLLKLRGGGMTSYKLYHATGAAYGVSKGISTTTTVSGNAYSVVSSATEHVHDQFQIEVQGGKDSSVQLTDLNIALAPGQLVSAVWAIRRGEKRGPYVLIHNHTTGVYQTVREALRPMVFPSRLAAIPLIVFTYAAIASQGKIAWPAWTGTQDQYLDMLIAYLCVYIPYAIFRRMVGSIRYSRFLKKSIPRLVRELENLAGRRKYPETHPNAPA